jgi:ketosteroid isomerase-like protein
MRLINRSARRSPVQSAPNTCLKEFRNRLLRIDCFAARAPLRDRLRLSRRSARYLHQPLRNIETCIGIGLKQSRNNRGTGMKLENEEKSMADEEENEKLVRAFYEATVPGHRESLRGLQAPHVIYDLPEGMPIGCGHFEGLQDVLERFLTSFYGALDVHFVAEEFIAAGDEVVALGRIEGKTRKAAVPIDVPFAHVWTVREGYLQRLRAFTDTAVLAHALAKQ